MGDLSEKVIVHAFSASRFPALSAVASLPEVPLPSLVARGLGPLRGGESMRSHVHSLGTSSLHTASAAKISPVAPAGRWFQLPQLSGLTTTASIRGVSPAFQKTATRMKDANFRVPNRRSRTRRW